MSFLPKINSCFTTDTRAKLIRVDNIYANSGILEIKINGQTRKRIEANFCIRKIGY